MDEKVKIFYIKKRLTVENLCKIVYLFLLLYCLEETMQEFCSVSLLTYTQEGCP